MLDTQKTKHLGERERNRKRGPFKTKQSVLALLFSALALTTSVVQAQQQLNSDADLGKIVPDVPAAA